MTKQVDHDDGTRTPHFRTDFRRLHVLFAVRRQGPPAVGERSLVRSVEPAAGGAGLASPADADHPDPCRQGSGSDNETTNKGGTHGISCQRQESGVK